MKNKHAPLAPPSQPAIPNAQHCESFRHAILAANTQLVEKWAVLAREAQFNPARLAMLTGVSLRTLERRFHSILHQPPKDWLSKRRVEEAMQRLAASLDPLKGIAASLGYKHHASFTHQFKKSTDFTPAEFRSFCKAHFPGPRAAPQHARNPTGFSPN